MTRSGVISTRGATQVRLFRDDFRIGQEACARIRLQIATDGLHKASSRLLSTDYEPGDTIPMWARIYADNRADYDRALSVLEGVQ